MSNVGKFVVYTLTKADADFINGSLKDGYVNNHHVEGQTLPAVVVRDWDAEQELENGQGSCNLQVFLDGHGSYWATSRKHGTEEGFWHG